MIRLFCICNLEFVVTKTGKDHKPLQTITNDQQTTSKRPQTISKQPQTNSKQPETTKWTFSKFQLFNFFVNGKQGGAWQR